MLNAATEKFYEKRSDQLPWLLKDRVGFMLWSFAIMMPTFISTGLGLGCPFQMPHLKLQVDRRAIFDV